MQRRAPNSTRLLWRQRAATYNAYPQQNVLKRFRDFIERTNWDEILLRREKWFDTLCVGGIIFSVLYFIPVLLVSAIK